MPPDRTGYAEAVFDQARAMRGRMDWRAIAPNWGSMAAAAGLIIGAMPIMDDGPGFFQPHPAPRRASSAAWRIIVAVRTGDIPEQFDRSYRPDRPGDDVRQLHGLTPPPPLPAALYGAAIDCLALDHTLARRPRRLVGAAAVLGIAPEWGEADAPVRVHRTVSAWLAGGCAGLVLVGDVEACRDVLLRCRAGIVGDDLAHGRALQKLLERPSPELPEIFIAAPQEQVAA